MPDPAVAEPTPSPAASPAPQAAVPATPTPAAAAAPAAPNPAEPAKTAEPAKPAVPESYDFKTLKLPDGIVLNDALVAAVSPILKELGVTQEGASKLVEAHSKALAEVAKVEEAKRETDFKDFMSRTVTEYQATVRKEWGTEYDANLAAAQKGIARVMSPAAKAILDETGLGNHPEFLKAFLLVGKMVSEDAPPASLQPSAARDAARILYPSMTTN